MSDEYKIFNEHMFPQKLARVCIHKVSKNGSKQCYLAIGRNLETGRHNHHYILRFDGSSLAQKRKYHVNDVVDVHNDFDNNTVSFTVSSRNSIQAKMDRF